jgi:PAS domain S-box-containing protein
MRPFAGRRALLALAIALSIGACIIGGFVIRRSVVGAATRALAARADLAQAYAARAAETQHLLLREIAHLTDGRSPDDLRAGESALDAELARLSAGMPWIVDMFVSDRDGMILASVKVPPVPRGVIADRPYFRALRAGAPEPQIGTALNEGSQPAAVVVIAARRADANGGFDGVYGLAVDPASRESGYVASGLANADAGFGIALLREDGTVLARAPSGLTADDTVWPGFAAAARGESGRLEGVPGRGTWAVEYRRVPGLPLYIAATMAKSALGNRLWQDLRARLYFAVPALAAVLLLIRQLLLRSVEAERIAADAARRADELARSEARARALFINSPDVRTITQEMPDGRFVFVDVNDAIETTFKLKREDVIGKTSADFYPPAMAEEVFARMRECLRTQRPVSYEARRVAAGQIRYFEMLLVPVTDPVGDGATRLIVTNTKDITERRQLEEQLREVQKIATLSQLAGGLAHDFNNVLMIVAGQQEMLKAWLDRNVTDERPHRYLRHASTGLARGVALVRRMMSFARRQDARPEALDLVAAIDNVAGFVRASVGALVKVLTALPPAPLMVRADVTQLELAVVNLALNARDAMPDGGTVTLAVLAADPAPDETDLVAGRYAVLEVRDTCTGMDEATLARAAEPFFTTKDPGKGTGLGLAMVRGLAVQTGGALRLHSQLGEGTTVALWLPLADDAPATG